MQRIAERTRLHSRGQILEAAVEAIGLADELGLTGEDRQTLLPQLLILVSQHHVSIEQTALQPGGLDGLLGKH